VYFRKSRREGFIVRLDRKERGWRLAECHS
jgi:hypothetical protein